MAPVRPRIALTIAGSDSGGGAGIQADLKTFHAFGVYGMSALTAITAQNTLGVQAVAVLDPALVGAQIDAVATDIGVDAAKTGMLADARIVTIVADGVRAHGIHNLVVDPVMVAKSGDRLLTPEAVAALRRELLPLAAVITPNLEEAEMLLGHPIRTLEAMRAAARELVAWGAGAAIVKGGHLGAGAGDPADAATDVLWDGRREVLLRGPRIATRHTHGTGCTFSAAITAGLALGLDLQLAAQEAKRFVQLAISTAGPLGGGRGPLNHLVPFAPQVSVQAGERL